MKISRLLLACAGLSALAACGGGSGGGGVSSTPTPAPSPTPSPVATQDITALTRSQTFTTIAATTDLEWGNVGTNIESTAQSNSAVTISYDAQNGTYTLTGPGRSQTFSNDSLKSTDDEETRAFTQLNGTGDSYLTLVDTGYFSEVTAKAVQIYAWQENTNTATGWQTSLDLGVIGFPSAASAVPTTGSARYLTEVFGLYNKVGQEPYVLGGLGYLIIDFDNENFQFNVSNFQQHHFGTQDWTVGGSNLVGSGTISSSELLGTVYWNNAGDALYGSIQGGFFGADAEEAGGTINASSDIGSTLTAAFAGAHSGGGGSLDIYDQLVPTTYPATVAFIKTETHDVGDSYVNSALSESNLSLKANQGWSYRGHEFASTDLVSAEGETPVYQQVDADAGKTYSLDLYGPTGVDGVVLTYSGFADYRIDYAGDGTYAGVDHNYIAYGLIAPEGKVDSRTGTASYEGALIGTASAGSSAYALSGDVHFDIDFSADSYGGWLDIVGNQGLADARDFGRYDVTPFESLDTRFSVGLQGGSSAEGSGTMDLTFFGPLASELGGTFLIYDGSAVLVGAAIARE